MGTLSIGVDNIHYDVFLSPKFVQTTREYLFDLIRQNVSSTYFSGIDSRTSKQVDSTTFRKLLTELLLSSLNRAKYQKNIEIDLLFRLAILKFISSELINQFANVILDGKEHIRKRGEYFERSQQAHVIKARLSEMQSARRDVVRLIGQLVAQIVNDIEETFITKARRALFGEDLTLYYELLKNRLIFLDGGKDDWHFLQHYVLLGNYARDPDRLEAMDEIFQQFLSEAGVRIPQEVASPELSESFRTLFVEADRLKKEIGALEEKRDGPKTICVRLALEDRLLRRAFAELERGQRHVRLEGGAGRIGAGQCAVHHRSIRRSVERIPARRVDAVDEQVWIEAGLGDEGKDAAAGRLDRHQRAAVFAEGLLGDFLQLDVQRQH
jgi:hypothetical protein